MVDKALARKLVDAVIADFPDHAPGTRPVHTVGVGVDGYFVASDVARSYSTAEHFQGQRVPVSVRFSNGSGSPERHDGWSDVRGMATRFYLRGDAATDLIAMTLGEFFAPDIDSFLEFSRDARPKPVSREKPWRKLLDMLQLKLPLPDPLPGQRESGRLGMLAFANRHASARLAVFQAGAIGAPTSYARATYHAVHTFIAVAPDGVRRPVRFTWQPVAGVRVTDSSAAPVDDYLTAELDGRLKKWPARFMLMMSIREPGDDITDPTRPWPAKRVRVVMGTLTLTNIAADQATFCERISFNPCRLPPGLEPSDDPILLARRETYEVSRDMRGGTACPFNRS